MKKWIYMILALFFDKIIVVWLNNIGPGCVKEKVEETLTIDECKPIPHVNEFSVKVYC